jgi:trehalose-phosphatase
VRALLDSWNDIAERIDRAGSALALTDFDGTLVPLEDHPEDVTVPAETRALLESFKSNPRLSIGVISGRSLADLEARVGVPGIWYVGNHGFELRTPSGTRRAFYDAEAARYVRAVERELADVTSNIAGVQIENKGPTLAVHYRRVDADRIGRVEQACRDAFYRHQKRLRLISGMCVHELRLREGFTKGTAVRVIRKESPRHLLPFYFGDDVTDDDVFRVLQGTGVCVRVGRRPSRLAEFSIAGPNDLLDVLSRISSILQGSSKPEHKTVS